MDGYSRYTAFGLDADDREHALEFWQQIGVPSASSQPGFRLAVILESDETPGRLRTITVWDRREDFDAYYASEEHQRLGAAIKGSGLRVEERDGLVALHVAPARVGHLRVIEADLPADAVDRVRTFWREHGRSLLQRQPGCLRAEAFVRAEPQRLVVSIGWRSEDDAEAFRDHPDHHAFAEGLGPDVKVVSRTSANHL
jgi:heme-degrading monooxygenase HmoA